MFDNSDFGYHKVTIERPDRRMAQFSKERIENLRFDKSLREPMEWVYQQWGEGIYEAGTLKAQEKDILKWCEEQDLNLNAKQRKKLLSPEIWKKHATLVKVACYLMDTIGTDTFSDYNRFKVAVDQELKALAKDTGIKPSASDKNQILNAVSWYNETAEKVIRKVEKLSSDKLKSLLAHLACDQDDCLISVITPQVKRGNISPMNPAPTCAIARAFP